MTKAIENLLTTELELRYAIHDLRNVQIQMKAGRVTPEILDVILSRLGDVAAAFDAVTNEAIDAELPAIEDIRPIPLVGDRYTRTFPE